MSKGDDYYKLLGVGKSASEDEIKAAFRSKALELHPDKNPENAAAEAAFREVTNAYEVLKDARKRQVYDISQSGDSGTSTSYSSPQPGSPVNDDFDEWLRRWMREHGYGTEGQDEASRQKKWEERSQAWAEKVASWEEQKREAKLQKARDVRMRQRVANSRAARQAAVLQKFWQASPGLVWQDGLVLSILSALAFSSVWLLWPDKEQSIPQKTDIDIAQS